VLILDIAMPKMNGIEVTARVQKIAHEETVIILSMHADESYILRAVSAGKPFFSAAIAVVLIED